MRAGGARGTRRRRRPSPILVIVNPRSAGGRVGRRWSAIETTLHGALGDFEHRHTEGAGHAAVLCREAIERGVRDIVVLGGDGTLSEAVSGYFADGRPIDAQAAIGYMPFGTGGDFRRTVRLPDDLREAARVAARGEPRRIDAGRLRYTRDDGTTAERYFLNVAGFGIGGLVDRIVNRSQKALGGRVTFLLGTVQALAQYRNRRVRLGLDGGAPAELIVNNVAVCNGRYFGGGMQVAPEARVDDGLFDVVVFGDVRLRDFLAQGRRLYRGTHLDLEKVSFVRAARVEAEPADARDEVLLDVDGEQPGRLPASFEILPGALRFRCGS